MINSVPFKELEKYNRFDTKFYTALDNYKKFIKNKKTIKFLDAVSLEIPKTIKKNDLVFYNRGNNVRFKFALKEIENKYNYTVLRSKNNKFSESYISWYLSIDTIKEYIKTYISGSVVVSMNKDALANLEILYPDKKRYEKTTVTIENESKFKEIIKIYLREYHENIKIENYLSASFLVGSICEAILYQLLLDNGVRESIVKNKTFGQLIDFAIIKSIEDFNEGEFKKIQEFRNMIHPENMLRKIEKVSDIEKEIENTFQNIIKKFGL